MRIGFEYEYCHMARKGENFTSAPERKYNM